MSAIPFSANLPSFEYNKKHLNIVSSLIETKMSRKEVEVLAFFFSLDKGLTEHDMFNESARGLVKKGLGMSTSNLSMHLKRLINKKVLIRNELTRKIVANKHLIPDNEQQVYKIVLTLIK